MKLIIVLISFLFALNVYASIDTFPNALMEFIQLTPSNDDVIQRKGGSWVNRSMEQLKNDIGISMVGLSSNVTNSTTTGVELIGLSKVITPGTYVFEYYIRYQTSVITTGIKFGVNHSGTAAVMVANMRLIESTTAASTGAASQSTGTGRLMAGSSTRTKSTTSPNLGPTASADAANSDMLCVIEGLMIVTAIGEIELWHGSETLNATTVMIGSSLLLTKTN